MDMISHLFLGYSTLCSHKLFSVDVYVVAVGGCADITIAIDNVVLPLLLLQPQRKAAML